MPLEVPLREVIRNLLQYSDLTFRDFMELALYHPEYGYYQRGENPVGKEADYVTAPSLSPVFSFALGRLVDEFLSRGGDEMSTVVDIGCGDGSLLHSLYEPGLRARFYGVDRSLGRIDPSLATRHPALRFVRSLGEVPGDGRHLLIANELFDALPFARLVQRDEHLHELWVSEREGELDWSEHEAPAPYEDYFAARGIELADGQFVDLSLDWEEQYAELCRFVTRGVLVTFDYGYREKQLFDPRVRRFGTAAAYRQQRVTRDLLAAPGLHDLTAHINFSDLIRAGEREGLRTLYFDRQAKFLLALGAAEHELLRPIHDVPVASVEEGLETLQRREDARRLLLPDGIGDDLRVLVQEKNGGAGEWSFQLPLFER
ncbi:MAG TPA: SAM-dependent methyltransferase [Thermoanaerobaculia bacterium]|nr:SAM-dependent methyltransferase [Thermoanaerobaculia bacterium]